MMEARPMMSAATAEVAIDSAATRISRAVRARVAGRKFPTPQFLSIIPTNGFYEWLKTPGGKQHYCIGFKDGRPFALAGLWERWKDRASGEKGRDLHHHHGTT